MTGAAREPESPKKQKASGRGRGSVRGGLADLPLVEILRLLRAGEVRASQLPKATRADCVEMLTLEGRSLSEIAAILKVSDRTVARDRELVRTRNALVYDPGLPARVLGEVARVKEQTLAVLLRVARDSNASPKDRIRAGRAAWRTEREFLAALQSCGYAPSVGPDYRVSAHLPEEGPPTPDQIYREIEQLEGAATEATDDARVRRLVRTAARRATRLLKEGA